MKSVNW